MNDETQKPSMKLFWTNWIALTASSFGFIVRAFSVGEWGTAFGLTATQQGEILGVGLWPFALGIIFMSLVIDSIGYKAGLAIAWVLQFVSTILTLFAGGYWSLWIATFFFAASCGIVEAVINPVVATMFQKDKTKWLNILHAGWPGGLAIAGLVNIALGHASWKAKVCTMFIPIVTYGIMLISAKYPVHERVAAGIPYKEMLKEFGFLGALIMSFFVFFEIGRIAHFHWAVNIVLMLIVAVPFGIYVKSLGRWMLIILMLIMVPLATTELGTDGWITNLMESVLKGTNVHPGWILVYTCTIMTVLRFVAGPIIHKLSPLGLLALGAAFACVGLFFLSHATGIMILVAATIFACGKTFFWPTMLGVVSEQCPKGGALAINAVGGMGMISVGIVGLVYIGFMQDTAIASHVKAKDTALYGKYVTAEKVSVFGKYKALDPKVLDQGTEEDKAAISPIIANAKKSALSKIAILPIIMLVSYLIMIFYFISRGGYKPVELSAQQE